MASIMAACVCHSGGYSTGKAVITAAIGSHCAGRRAGAAGGAAVTAGARAISTGGAGIAASASRSASALIPGGRMPQRLR